MSVVLQVRPCPLCRKKQDVVSGFLKCCSVLFLNEEPVSLCSPHLWVMFKTLLLRRGILVSSEELIEYVWPDPDTQAETASEALRVKMTHLRKLSRKIDITITARHGRGYILT